jgi:RNA polymerase subunit RPABC4/transcription elongation factor Spt4
MPLPKPCRKCGKRFFPFTRANKVCPDCHSKRLKTEKFGFANKNKRNWRVARERELILLKKYHKELIKQK